MAKARENTKLGREAKPGYVMAAVQAMALDFLQTHTYSVAHLGGSLGLNSLTGRHNGKLIPSTSLWESSRVSTPDFSRFHESLSRDSLHLVCALSVSRLPWCRIHP